jgi:hypothetical protein
MVVPILVLSLTNKFFHETTAKVHVNWSFEEVKASYKRTVSERAEWSYRNTSFSLFSSSIVCESPWQIGE